MIKIIKPVSVHKVFRTAVNLNKQRDRNFVHTLRTALELWQDVDPRKEHGIAINKFTGLITR